MDSGYYDDDIIETIVFKAGREKSSPSSDFMKWIVKNVQNGENYANVKGVPLQPSPFGVKMLAKFARHGIRVGIIIRCDIRSAFNPTEQLARWRMKHHVHRYAPAR
jgi:hypothetical protein